MSCKALTVSCSNTVDLVVNIGVLTPSGTTTGTVTLTDGSGGTSIFNNGYVAIYSAAKLKVVQIQYTTSWTDTGMATNLTVAACRPATISKAIFTNIHGGDLTKGFAVHGQSGGCAGNAFTLSWYGGDSWIDYMLCSAGPSFANTTAACIVPASSNVTVCPTGQSYCSQTSESFSNVLEFTPCSRGDSVLYPCNCGGTSNSTQIAAWNSMSILNGYSNSYSHTEISSWVCSAKTSGSNNNDPASAQLYHAKITATNGHTLKIIQDCTGAEDIWNGVYNPTGASGLTASSNALIAGCVPHH